MSQGKKKIFVLDTNVLIHDPHAIYAFDDNIVVIPIEVIEELDKLKKRAGEVGRNAREAAREIDKYRGQLNKGSSLPNNGTLIVQAALDKELIRRAEEFQLYKGLTDNSIILTAYTLHLKSNNIVKFISKDLNARIKADALGIITEDYEKKKANVRSEYLETPEIKVPSQSITTLYNSKHLNPEEIGLNKEDIFPNQYFYLQDENDVSIYAYAIYDASIPGIRTIKYKGQPIWGIKALNKEQFFAFEFLLDPNIQLVSLVGPAGTGKTLLAIAAGLKQTLDDKIYKKLFVARPIVPLGKDIGYLPGSKDEKLFFWMQPIFDNLEFIFYRNREQEEKHKPKKSSKPTAKIMDEIKFLMDSDVLELEALTYIRGRSIPKSFIIIDEAQNLTPHEIKTLISRAGEDTKIVLTGDPYQIDHPYLDFESNGLMYLMDRFRDVDIFASVFLHKSERSELASLAAELL